MPKANKSAAITKIFAAAVKKQPALVVSPLNAASKIASALPGNIRVSEIMIL